MRKDKHKRFMSTDHKRETSTGGSTSIGGLCLVITNARHAHVEQKHKSFMSCDHERETRTYARKGIRVLTLVIRNATQA